MVKKQAIIYVIILVIVSGIVGIVSYNIGANNKNNSILKESNNNNNSNKNDVITLTREQLAQYTTELPITIDNWKDYIELEDKEEENKDAFGEITRIDKYTSLKIKDNICGYITIEYEITDKNLLEYPTNPTQTVTIESGKSSNNYINFITDKNNDKSITKDRTFTINYMKCNRIKGKLYTIDLPDDIWGNQNKIIIETSEKFRENVDGDNGYINISKDNYIQQLGHMISLEEIDYRKH